MNCYLLIYLPSLTNNTAIQQKNSSQINRVNIILKQNWHGLAGLDGVFLIKKILICWIRSVPWRKFFVQCSGRPYRHFPVPLLIVID